MNFKTCLWGKINRNAMTHLRNSMHLVGAFFTGDGPVDSALSKALCQVAIRHGVPGAVQVYI